MTQFLYLFVLSLLAAHVIAEDGPKVTSTVGKQLSDECELKPRNPELEGEVCCHFPNIVRGKDNDGMRKIMESCVQILVTEYKEILPDGQPELGDQPPLELIECAKECIFNQSSFINADLTLNVEAMKKTVLEYLDVSDTWKQIINEAIETCSQTGPKRVKESASCKSGSYQITMCVLREMYLKCPSNSWNDKELCKAERSEIEDCPLMPLSMGLMPPRTQKQPVPQNSTLSDSK